ncbi:MAG: hypothetical protein GY873_25250 [Bosea sp.]|uniref:hypothetical protein n=1 Tax=Bosea sp. (in: a-proteobacteria) TaxID=1871050 RepID=UPI002392771F|nr:hypothetical protein [Bosea sp. (in: a-proteobacteria)]MCP4737505.1 hypothetical protein [Bosea sp. (in: a-proteobacteria)]
MPADDFVPREPDPFAVLIDPVDIARVHAAVDCAWTALQSRCRIAADPELARASLYGIVASNIHFAADDHDLIRRSIDHFLVGRRREGAGSS